jgi:radical SAM-linked protein
MLHLRIKFQRDREIRFISHLDILRLWQRALHRARIPLAYSEGFSPHPRISMAAPLSIWVPVEAELM